jgi:hypothetical protein
MTPVPLHRTIGRGDNFAIVFRPNSNLMWDVEGIRMRGAFLDGLIDLRNPWK